MTDITVELVNQTIEVEVGPGVGPQGSQGPAGTITVNNLPISVIPAVADGTDQSALINASLASATTWICILPAGEFRYGSTITIPAGKTLLGAGREKTILKPLASFGPLPSGNGSIVLGDNARIADLSLDVNKQNNGMAASLRIHGIIGRGVNFVVERVNAKNVTGYAFFGAGASSLSLARGVFRDCYAENANALFETNNSDGVTFENCVGADGANDINLDAAFHVLSTSRNITFRDCSYSGDSQIINISANVGDQENIVFENCRGSTTASALGVFIGVSPDAVAPGTNEVFFSNCKFYSAGGTALQSEVVANIVQGVNCHFQSGNGNGISMVTGIGYFSNCRAIGYTSDLNNAAYGVFGFGSTTRFSGAGRAAATGGPGSGAQNGGVILGADVALT